MTLSRSEMTTARSLRLGLDPSPCWAGEGGSRLVKSHSNPWENVGNILGNILGHDFFSIFLGVTISISDCLSFLGSFHQNKTGCDGTCMAYSI